MRFKASKAARTPRPLAPPFVHEDAWHADRLLLGMGRGADTPSFVMPGLGPGIHAVTAQQAAKPVAWIAGSSPALTSRAKPGIGTPQYSFEQVAPTANCAIFIARSKFNI